MSSTERSREFRERCKQDPVKYKTYLSEEREKFKLRRDKQKLALQNDKVKLKLKQKQDKIRQRQYREKIKSLPETRKHKAVVAKLLVDELLEIGKRLKPLQKLKKKEHGKRLNKETKDNVVEFYLRDDVNRTEPGKKDKVAIKNIQTGKKEAIQKLTMMMTIAEANKEFRKEYPDCSVQNLLSCDEETVNNEIKWSQWKDVEGHLQIVMETGTVYDYVNKIQMQLTAFKLHCYMERKKKKKEQQSKQFEDVKKRFFYVIKQLYRLISQKTTPLFKMKHNALTGVSDKSPFSLLLFGGKVYNYAIISDDLLHSKYSVWVFIKTLLQDLKIKVVQNIHHVKIFSDGCAAQFKNHFTMLTSHIFYSTSMFLLIGISSPYPMAKEQ
ncbi:hypothetical protein PR048_030083 [Dryococelus australis]|uniref:Uncharacterized protein n=1 Tax=Dryococelus australis TaxID=614101 RepID=A0ABQ9G7Y1_9NEOP|nr:hypothetical protein PR048_030083 [Dryococelus australis]